MHDVSLQQAHFTSYTIDILLYGCIIDRYIYLDAGISTSPPPPRYKYREGGERGGGKGHYSPRRIKLNHYTHREIFSKSYQIKPKSHCNYHAPIDLEVETANRQCPFVVPNQSENCKFNLISV